MDAFYYATFPPLAHVPSSHRSGQRQFSKPSIIFPILATNPPHELSQPAMFGLDLNVKLKIRACHSCQARKIGIHTKTPLNSFDSPDRPFGDIHVDLVGPFPPSEGCTYLFTIIDRFTRWPEAVPIQNAEATKCARALLRTWIARFGVPDSITSDQGPQFTSGLWRELYNVLGCSNKHTTAYHPQSNGMVERFHRSLKAALKARLLGPGWMDELPIVLLGIRST
ncbi:hypothetical protein RRG08_045938 [Elysia crispata]|uniref:Integrase catalytic domain-containing protein n=1 Tax=Elysia crispata TaxID=231223 RepID=A0AAE1AQY0_9GAST|nr:hypothetical protein RRG08_045938 [Elysia crispata]